jgi:hypothetical protein
MDYESDLDGPGAAYLFLGPLQGRLRPSDADLAFTGEAGTEGLGWDALGPGDLDGDGLADLTFSRQGAWDGVAYVIFGRRDIVQHFAALADP